MRRALELPGCSVNTTQPPDPGGAVLRGRPHPPPPEPLHNMGCSCEAPHSRFTDEKRGAPQGSVEAATELLLVTKIPTQTGSLLSPGRTLPVAAPVKRKEQGPQETGSSQPRKQHAAAPPNCGHALCSQAAPVCHQVTPFASPQALLFSRQTDQLAARPLGPGL